MKTDSEIESRLEQIERIAIAGALCNDMAEEYCNLTGELTYRRMMRRLTLMEVEG